MARRETEQEWRDRMRRAVSPEIDVAGLTNYPPESAIDPKAREFTPPPSAVATTLAQPEDTPRFTPPPGRPAPVSLPPETVEATRLPRVPIVEGTVMRRGAPGSGEFGELGNLTPVRVERFTPMSRAEAEQRGIVAPAARPFSFTQVGRAPGGVNAGMGHSLDSWNRERMDATREARWGQSGPTRQGRVDAILDSLRGERAADAESGRRMREGRVLPVGSGDTVYDPLTGQAHTPQKVAAKPQAWDEYAPEDLEGMINRTVKSILPADQEKAMWAELGTATTDEAKAAVIGKYTRSATPEQRLVLDNAYEALRRKSIVKGGGKGGEGKKSIGGITAN